MILIDGIGLDNDENIDKTKETEELNVSSELIMTKEKIFETINKLCEKTDVDDIIGCIEDTSNAPSNDLNDYIMDGIQRFLYRR